MTSKFQSELTGLINSQCQENESNTPDYILARYLVKCLEAFNEATNDRSIWYQNDVGGRTKFLRAKELNDRD